MASLMTRRKFLGCLGHYGFICASCSFFPCAFVTPSTRAAVLKKGAIGRKLSPYFTALDDQTIRCELCPHHCEIEKGKRGLCKVRENIDGKCYSLVYGNPCAINIDPIEKKPFYHVLPGTRSFSVATAGCNFV